MRKILKQGMATVLGLSLMLGVTGSLEGSVSIPYSGTAEVKAAVGESSQKAAADGIDILDYENNTSATEFVVNDIAGMEKLAELVNSGKEIFTGKTITLTADLKYDKTVVNNHKVIGQVIYGSPYKFDGIFNGAFHTISGINLNSDSGKYCFGLFGRIGNNAKITKLILENSCITSPLSPTKICPMGGICGENWGVIDECISRKNVEITGGSVSVGGIVGSNIGSISKCINLSTVRGIDSNVGGIAGNGGGNIIECCNMGNISYEVKENSSTILSGIGGIVGNGGGNIINCYNVGQISAVEIAHTIEDMFVGGIRGCGMGPSWKVQNSYSVGEVKNGFPGAIISIDQNHVGELKNCYWLTGVAPIGVCESGRTSFSSKQDTSSVFEYTQEQMCAQLFVDELNSNSIAAGYDNIWVADIENINNGYPILKNAPYELLNSSENQPNEPLDTTPVSHFYEDYDYSKQATNSTIRIYSNGGTMTVPGKTEKKNYKQCILYTDILPSYIYTVGKNGVVKPSSGKVIVGITSSDQKPELVKGKIVDKDAAKIASASIRSGQITVTAKTLPGKVYLWAIDTGKAAAAACIPVTVKPAPTTTYLYAVPDTNTSFTYGTTKQFKSGKVSVGESIKVYLYPTYKQNGTVLKAPNVSYTASVASKAADYFSVEQSGNNPYCFEIRAKSLKNNKSVTGAITFTCGLNGRKTVFQATAINPVVSISTANGTGLTRNSDNSFTITASNTAKTSGTFELKPVCCSPTEATTDKLQIFAMGNANGYNAAKLQEGKVQITAKRSTAQSKISLKAASDKKTITVTAAKGTKPVTAYFLIVYNTKNDDSKKGYTVISVTAD